MPVRMARKAARSELPLGEAARERKRPEASEDPSGVVGGRSEESGASGGGDGRQGCAISFFGSGVFGVSSFGGTLQTIFETSTVGSGFAVSLQYESDSTNPPYTFDAATIEYATHDRR